MRAAITMTTLACALVVAACDVGSGGMPGGGADSGPGAGADSAPGAGPDGGRTCVAAKTGSGDGTYYAADGSGNCSFDPSPNDLMVAAMNTTDYQGSRACGACVHIVGPDGEATVRIVDRCPGCSAGDIDLSQQAFAKLAPLAQGRIPITWRYVACQVSGPISYQIKDGTSQYWAAVQVRNIRYAVASVEARASGGTWQPIQRQLYNYFVAPKGFGTGPIDLRVTDVNGHQLVDRNLVIDASGSIDGAAQFPACAAQ